MEVYNFTVQPKENACSIDELYKKFGDSLPLYKEFTKDIYVFLVDTKVDIEKIVKENNYEIYGRINIITIDSNEYNKDYRIVIEYSGKYLEKII